MVADELAPSTKAGGTKFDTSTACDACTGGAIGADLALVGRVIIVVVDSPTNSATCDHDIKCICYHGVRTRIDGKRFSGSRSTSASRVATTIELISSSRLTVNGNGGREEKSDKREK